MKNINILKKIANNLRCITMDAVVHAGSGHPGMPMGCAEIFAYLYGEFMHYHPKVAGKWVNRDRLILSAGHGALGQLISLHIAGYDITIDDLKQHRQGSIKASSHPIYNPDIGIETTTGADGYGIANAVGIALGQKILLNQLYSDQTQFFDEKIIVIGGDGCFMEGISYEAAQLAGHLKLNNLIIIYDANNVSLDGYVGDSCSTNYVELYKALGFDVFSIDGHDLLQIDSVLKPLRTHQDKPIFIIANTQIGRGLIDKQGTLSAHSSNLSDSDVDFFQKNLFFNHKPWMIEDELYKFFQKKHTAIENKIQLKYEQNEIDEQYVLEVLDQYFCENLEQPGRFLSQNILNHLTKYFPQIYAGSADSSHSDGTWIQGTEFITAASDYKGRNIKFGVREFAMAAAANGLAQTQYIIPIIGGFFAFSDYLKAALRFAAMMKLKVICSFSHDSIFLGEDGPTHQPIEQLAMFRAMPNTLVIRPADMSEIKFAWVAALTHNGPTIIALARQTLSNFDLAKNYEDTVKRGAYVVQDIVDPDVVIYASGSEVKLALNICEKLNKNGIATRAISVPSFELFDKQTSDYQAKILNHSAKISVSIEAGHELGWHKWIGKDGIAISVKNYGISEKSEKIADIFGFNAEKIITTIMHRLALTNGI